MYQPDFRHLAALLKHLSAGDLVDVRKAFDFVVKAHALQNREDGTPYVLHVIRVAEIVAEWKADRDTVIAALLHDVIEDTPVHKEEIAEKFGRKTAMLVEGITKFSQADLSPDLPLDRKIETLRKLFDVMRLDMRSILIKLADRLHNVQTIDALPTAERRRRFAIETLTVYYKIAFHLGLRNTRRTFAELCVPHAFDAGSSEKALRDEMCLAAARITESVKLELRKHAESYGLLSVTMFPRNLLIFHERIKERGGNPLVQDAFSISVIVRTEDDCYQLLKTLHTLYRPLSGQFRDFIAAPSDAGYQSLHTFVSLPDGLVIEVRIRTPEMYEQAMQGITMTLFDPNAPQFPSFSWLKRSEVLDLKTRDSSSAFWEALESDIFSETISVNIDRKRMSLPKGSTALDAAYALYNDRAGHTSSLTVNGRTVQGSEPLKEDDEVHVTMDNKHPHVTFDWLQMISTRHARLLIVDVLKQTEKSEKIALGATLLQKELDHYNKGLLAGLSRNLSQSVAEHFRRETFDQVLSMIGEGVIRARDVVFFLYPERGKSFFRLRKSSEYPFRFRITATLHEDQEQDILSDLQGVLKGTNITPQNLQIRPHKNKGTADIFLSGTCSDRLVFADFVEVLERKEWISKTESMLSARQRAFIMALFGVAFVLILLDILLFPLYQPLLLQLSRVPQVIVHALPLIPILIVNYYLLRILRHYVVRIRSDRWFLGIGLVLNFIGLVLLVLHMVLLQDAQFSLLPLIVIFVLALVYTAYKFFQTEALFTHIDQRSLHPPPPEQWRERRRQKIFGYLIRLCAVIIWGFQPLLLKYTPASTVDPFVRVYLMSFGATLAIALLFLLQKGTSSGRLLVLRVPWNRYLAGIVIGQALFLYFMSAGLLYTTSTNFILLNNFAPVFALLVAALFWRHSIPYLRDPKHMLWIFLLFLMGSTGGSLIIYRSTQLTGTQTILGDVLALFAMVTDVLIITSQIRYTKLVPTASTTSLIAHMFGVATLVLTVPVLLYLSFTESDVFTSLSLVPVLCSLGLGAVTVVGMVCNFEAFRRIDGNIAFLMLNLSILINFIAEAFFLKTIVPTWTLIIGGTIIIGATILAECVNSRCERKGL